MSDLVDGVFFSSLIQKNLPYRVLVPDGQYAETLPVLYLLHGLFGSFENWTDLTGIQRYVRDSKLLVVMPYGGDNWYTDSQEKYESYLIDDLLPDMERRFRASTERHERAIAGNSMGGYGALKLALRRPEIFGHAASFSGAFGATRFLEGSVDAELSPSIKQVFGAADSPERIDNDIYALAASAMGKSGELPEIYFDCGSGDAFISANREFAAVLSKVGIDHEYLEIEGGHDWPYWNGRIEYFISVLKQKFVV